MVQEYIRSVCAKDGCRLRYRVWSARGGSRATMMFVHGMMSHSGWFRELALLLASHGLRVIGADRRGSGLNHEGRGDAPSREALISDLQEISSAEHNGSPVYPAGWCWGALPVLNLAAESDHRLSGVVLLAPGLFPSAAVQRAALHQMVASRAESDTKPVIRSPLTPDMFSDRFSVQEFIATDPLAQRVFTRRFFAISAEMSCMAVGAMERFTAPVLLLLAQSDRTVDNERTLGAVQRMPNVTSAVLACNHGMQFEVPDEIVGHVAHWLSDVALRMENDHQESCRAIR